MAALTFAQLTTEVKNIVDDGSTTNTTTIERWTDLAIQDVARARDWAELMRRDVVTLVAPYITGTVTTNGTTTVTGSGTLWSTEAVTGRKFALGYGSPFGVIASVGGETSLTLADAYLGDDVAAHAYTIYQDVVALPASCNRVLRVYLHDDASGPRLWPTDGFGGYVHQAATPTRYAVIERSSSGAMQIQVGPYAPDKAYHLEVVYRASPTASKWAGDSGTNITLDDDKADLVLQRALYLSTRRDSKRAAQELQIYQSMLADKWSNAPDEESGPLYVPEQRARPYAVADERWRDLEG